MGAPGIATASDVIQVITSPAVSNHATMLAVEITKAHEQATRTAQSSLEHARRAGELLLKAKSQYCRHGEWLPWLGRHCPSLPPRTAQVYMTIARRWPGLPNTPRA